jgi:hypothetical protein
VEDARLELLRLIGPQGKRRAALVAEGVDPYAVGELVSLGYFETRYVDLSETGPPTPSRLIYMLTPAGAEAIDLDPARIGLS